MQIQLPLRARTATLGRFLTMTGGLATPYLPAAPLPPADIVLYLDFDGVLHHEAVMWHPRRGIYMNLAEAVGRKLFEWADALEAILSEFPLARLVLSSSWCVRPGYGKALKYLAPGLRERFVGGTFHKRAHGADAWTLQSFAAMPRWQQIFSDVERRHPSAWLALDDDVVDWPDQFRRNLVACDGETGISSPKVQADLRAKLGIAFSAGVKTHRT